MDDKTIKIVELVINDEQARKKIEELSIRMEDLRQKNSPSKPINNKKTLIRYSADEKPRNPTETIARKTFHRPFSNFNKAIFFFPKASFGPINTKKADFHGSAFSFARQRYNISERIPNCSSPTLRIIVRKRAFVYLINSFAAGHHTTRKRRRYTPKYSAAKTRKERANSLTKNALPLPEKRRIFASTF